MYTNHATTPIHMELLSQLDVANPDHVSVITRAGKVTISVKKDGAEVTVGFPIKGQVFNMTPRPPLQQPAPKLMAVKESQGNVKARIKPVQFHNNKLTESDVREIKAMLGDHGIMSKFNSRHQAYIEIGKAYKVSLHAIANIAKGKAWSQVN
ncbi:MAG: hypothetical protein EBU08_11865 [Micrococcales bacterium]|nr:hypothetical protein [Micrococcales bacterium]